MFNMASLLFLVLLAVGAAASPAIAPVVAHEATVALRNRDNGTTLDGVFDQEKALQSIAKTINKHRQNLINLEKNKGPNALPKGAVIEPRAAVPSDVEARMLGRQAEALTDQENGVEWTGTVSIGTPGQDGIRGPLGSLLGVQELLLWLQVDIQGLKLSHVGEKERKILDHLHRSHHVSVSRWTDVYGVTDLLSLGSISEDFVKDDVTVAGITVTKQWFSAVTSMTSNYASNPADGILGLAFPAASYLNQSSFFITAYTEKKFKKNQFGFFLATSGSELFLGGTDTAKYDGGLEFHAIDSSSGLWLIPGAGVKVGNTVAISGFETVIDSGTTFMYAPFADAEAVYAQIPGGALYDAVHGFFEYTCQPQPKISFNWGGKDWVVSSAYFNLGKLKGSTKCIGALVGQGPLGNPWVLGDVFMQNVYTAFDLDKEAVGFAALA
ncbi:Acid protease [Mycena sanguinolenta]|uniref:Acid protease n=1 Tax=Mycena sanguinolenta TaxID=230812 RepID=A0A8H6XJT1_9AGAR|nr:Acid protease [Mycena sanguinolenta]